MISVVNHWKLTSFCISQNLFTFSRWWYSNCIRSCRRSEQWPWASSFRQQHMASDQLPPSVGWLGSLRALVQSSTTFWYELTVQAFLHNFSVFRMAFRMECLEFLYTATAKCDMKLSEQWYALYEVHSLQLCFGHYGQEQNEGTSPNSLQQKTTSQQWLLSTRRHKCLACVILHRTNCYSRSKITHDRRIDWMNSTVRHHWQDSWFCWIVLNCTINLNSVTWQCKRGIWILGECWHVGGRPSRSHLLHKEWYMTQCNLQTVWLV